MRKRRPRQFDWLVVLLATAGYLALLLCAPPIAIGLGIAALFAILVSA